MRTFEFKDDKSNKFWNIELQGKQFTVAFGKIGTKGQTQTKEFADEAKAQAAHEKLVAEKLGKGYVETSGTQPAKAAGPSPLQTSLEQALVDNPDDLAAHAAYADYLTEQGDPRGEFIQVQLALEDPKRLATERNELQAREQALLAEHAGRWLGGLAEALDDCEYVFARGWLDSLSFGDLSLACARALSKAPEARLLRRLEIQNAGFIDEEATDDEDEEIDESEVVMAALAKTQSFPNLRVFQLGELANPGEIESINTQMNFRCDAVTLVKKMPRLEELYLGAHGVDVGKLFALKSLTHLRILQVDHVEEVYPLEILARNSSLSKLTDLLICPHGFSGTNTGDNSYLPLSRVREVLRSPHLGSLKHLRLRLSDMGDAGCEEIVQSGILKRLKVLDLAQGCISDKGAEVLARSPDLNLDWLVIRSNWVSDAGVKALKARVANLQADSQFAPGSDESMYGGDME